MKICHVITRLIVGGAQENALSACVAHAARGHHAVLLAGPPEGPEGSLVPDARTAPIEHVEEPTLVRAVRPLTDRRCLRRLAAHFRRIGPDVVHTHSSKAGLLARIAARRAGVRCIVHSIEGMSFNRTQSAPVQWLYARLERYAAGFTDRLIAVAEAMIDQSVAAGVAPREKFTVVRSGIETHRYDPARVDRGAARRELGLADDDVAAVTVARMFDNKGYDLLIDALPGAVEGCDRLRFVWVGGGIRQEEYLARVAAVGLAGRVIATGLVAPERIPAMLAAADLVVHPSRWEGLPRVIVQGLLMGKPAVCFAIDGQPEVVVPDQTGLLVEPFDTAALGRAVGRLAADPDARRRMGAEGRRRCLGPFDIATMVDGYEAVYREVLDAKA